MTRPISFRPDYTASQQLEQRSWQRAVTAHALAVMRHENPSKIVKAAWPSDERAHLMTRGAVEPLSTDDWGPFDAVTAYRSLAPASAALRLFGSGLALSLAGQTTIRIPSVAGTPPQAVFVGEGLPAPVLQWSFAPTVLGPARKILLLSAV